jgi:hypothetical protein
MGTSKDAKCAICHQIGPGAQNLVGPELNGIVGRKAASVADYATYSAGMKKLGAEGFTWTEEHLDQWIADPKAMIADGARLPRHPRCSRAGGHHRLSEEPLRAWGFTLRDGAVHLLRVRLTNCTACRLWR